MFVEYLSTRLSQVLSSGKLPSPQVKRHQARRFAAESCKKALQDAWDHAKQSSSCKEQNRRLDRDRCKRLHLVLFWLSRCALVCIVIVELPDLGRLGTAGSGSIPRWLQIRTACLCLMARCERPASKRCLQFDRAERVRHWFTFLLETSWITKYTKRNSHILLFGPLLAGILPPTKYEKPPSKDHHLNPNN